MADQNPPEVETCPDNYLEARLALLEELLTQLMGGIPDHIGQRLAGVYNVKRQAILNQYFPHLKEPVVEEPTPEKGRIITFPH